MMQLEYIQLSLDKFFLAENEVISSKSILHFDIRLNYWLEAIQEQDILIATESRKSFEICVSNDITLIASFCNV